MADKNFGFNALNRKSVVNNLDDIKSLHDLYQPSYGIPAHSPSTIINETTVNTTQPPPPPLPSRHQTHQQPPINYLTPSYNNFNNPYNSYNPYNNFNNGYPNNYSYNNNYTFSNNNNSFSQQAETTTRQAFESVESVVRTFSSISLMLDSTYQAVFNSFRAVLSVSDHISRLRSHFSSILTTLALFPFFRSLLRKLKYIMTLMRHGSRRANEEAIWHESSTMAELSTSDNNLNNTAMKTWPMLLFFTVVTTGSWLLWKLLSTFNRKQQNLHDHHIWSRKKTQHYIANAQYDFQASQADELSFQKHSRLLVAPDEFQTKSPKGWLMASVDGEKVGLIPRNYVKIISKQPPLQTTPLNLIPEQHLSEPIKTHQSQPIKNHNLQPIKNHNLQPIKNHNVQPVKNHNVQPIKTHHSQPILTKFCTNQEIAQKEESVIKKVSFEKGDKVKDVNVELDRWVDRDVSLGGEKENEFVNEYQQNKEFKENFDIKNDL